jgi:hypothetical protein
MKNLPRLRLRSVQIALIGFLLILSGFMAILTSDSMAHRLQSILMGSEKIICVGANRFEIGKEWHIEFVWHGKGTMPLYKGMIPIPGKYPVEKFVGWQISLREARTNLPATIEPRVFEPGANAEFKCPSKMGCLPYGPTTNSLQQPIELIGMVPRFIFYPARNVGIFSSSKDEDPFKQIVVSDCNA